MLNELEQNGKYLPEKKKILLMINSMTDLPSNIIISPGSNLSGGAPRLETNSRPTMETTFSNSLMWISRVTVIWKKMVVPSNKSSMTSYVTGSPIIL